MFWLSSFSFCPISSASRVQPPLPFYLIPYFLFPAISFFLPLQFIQSSFLSIAFPTVSIHHWILSSFPWAVLEVLEEVRGSKRKIPSHYSLSLRPTQPKFVALRSRDLQTVHSVLCISKWRVNLSNMRSGVKSLSSAQPSSRTIWSLTVIGTSLMHPWVASYSCRSAQGRFVCVEHSGPDLYRVQKISSTYPIYFTPGAVQQSLVRRTQRQSLSNWFLISASIFFSKSASTCGSPWSNHQLLAFIRTSASHHCPIRKDPFNLSKQNDRKLVLQESGRVGVIGGWNRLNILKPL